MEIVEGPGIVSKPEIHYVGIRVTTRYEAFLADPRVEVRWDLADKVSHAWSASVTTWVHAGEDMLGFAGRLRELFDAR